MTSGEPNRPDRTVGLVAGLLAVTGLIGWLLFATLGSDSADRDARVGPRGETSQPVAPAEAVLNPEQAREALDRGAIPLDVRTVEEYASGHVQGAEHADVTAADFEESVSALDPDRAYIVYCASGNRAGTAIEIMTRLGFEDLSNGGGFTDLAASGVPTSKHS